MKHLKKTRILWLFLFAVLTMSMQKCNDPVIDLYFHNSSQDTVLVYICEEKWDAYEIDIWGLDTILPLQTKNIFTLAESDWKYGGGMRVFVVGLDVRFIRVDKYYDRISPDYPVYQKVYNYDELEKHNFVITWDGEKTNY